MALAIFTLITLTALATARAQNASQNVLPQGFAEGQAVLRSAFQASDFVSSYANAANAGNQYGSIKAVLGNALPALYTLPNNGIAQGVISLNACALWSPHYHPRANEVLFVSQGSLNITFAEENPTSVGGATYGGRILNVAAGPSNSVTIPQGLIHYIFNPTCSPASIVTSFDNRDPGVVSIVQQLFNLADSVISAATGLEQLSVQLARQTVTQTAVIGVDKACLAACNSAAGNASAPAAG